MSVRGAGCNSSSDRAGVKREILVVEKAGDDAIEIPLVRTHYAERDFRSQSLWKPVDTGRYSWKSNRANCSMLSRDLKRPLVGAAQRFRLATIAAVPDGADRVNDEARFQSKAGCEHCVSVSTRAERNCSGGKGRTSRSVDRAVHAPTTGQRGIRRIYDRVNVQSSDVTLDDLDHYLAPRV